MRPSAVNTDERPFVLVWEVTQACKLACEHCRADAQPRRHPDELSTAEGKALLDAAAEFGDGQLVVLSGGDPLARTDLIDLVEYGTSRGLRMTLTPSGTRSLTPAVIADLADAGLQRMALSLDGASADAHDAFRGEAGSFEQTVAAAEAAREAGLPLQINTTVCDATVDELPALRDRVADLGAVLWSVFFLVPVGRGRVLDPVSPERSERVMEWLHEVSEVARFGVKTTEAPHYRRVGLQRAHGEGPDGSGDDSGAPGDGTGTPDTGTAASSDCSDVPRDGTAAPDADAIGRRAGIRAGDGFAFVSHVGEVFPSGFLPESAGNVREDDLVDIYRNAYLFEALRDPDGFRGKCGACPFRNVCGGSRSRAYAHTGDPLASDPLCPYVPEGYDGPLPWDSPAGPAEAD